MPSSSQARRCTGVGVVMVVNAGRPPEGWMLLAAMVARSASRVAKLCTGSPSGVVLAAILARSAGAGAVGAEAGDAEGGDGGEGVAGQVADVALDQQDLADARETGGPRVRA
jgi:hypothetical protein